MPLLKIQTNVSVPPDKTGALLQSLTDFVVREMNKPKDYVQTLLEPNQSLAFAGTSQPNAFVELRSLDLAENKTKALSAAIAALLEEHLGIPPGRVFINFFDVPRPMWGWNGSTFA
jgi:phenylpyruvate tautomerase